VGEQAKTLRKAGKVIRAERGTSRAEDGSHAAQRRPGDRWRDDFRCGLTMAGRSKYVTVTRRRGWSLSYPRYLWQAMTEDERRAVVTRQQALFDAMQRTNGAKVK